MVVWKIKFKYLKVGEMFLQVFGYFSKHLNIDVVNIYIYLVNWVIFITKIITNPLKMWDMFGVLFQVQMIWHKLLLKARGRLEMPMKKKIHLFWNARGWLEVWKTIFFVFSNIKQSSKYVQNILLAPNKDWAFLDMMWWVKTKFAYNQQEIIID
jgi:hypothetical protein